MFINFFMFFVTGSLLSLHSIVAFSSNRGLRGTVEVFSYKAPSGTYYCKADYQCPTNSYCDRFNSTTGICGCEDEYASKDRFCDYTRKNGDNAAVLSLLNLIGPMGIFYALDGIESSSKFMKVVAYLHLFTCGFIGFVIVLPLILLLNLFTTGKKCEEFIPFFGLLYVLMSFIWVIVDVTCFLNGTYVDAHGIDFYNPE